MKIYAPWQHWNVMNFSFFFSKSTRRNKYLKNLFDDVDDDEGKKGNQHKWFSILMFLCICSAAACSSCHHRPGYIENMCFTLKHHPRTGFVLMEILNFLMRLHKGAVCAYFMYLMFLCSSTLLMLFLFWFFSLFREDKWIFFLMFSFYAGSSYIFYEKKRQNKRRVWSEQIHQADWKMKELGQGSTHESDWFFFVYWIYRKFCFILLSMLLVAFFKNPENFPLAGT